MSILSNISEVIKDTVQCVSNCRDWIFQPSYQSRGRILEEKCHCGWYSGMYAKLKNISQKCSSKQMILDKPVGGRREKVNVI